MDTQKDKPKHKQETFVIQFCWENDFWVDCTDCIYSSKLWAIARLIMLRAEPTGVTYRLIRRTEEEIA